MCQPGAARGMNARSPRTVRRDSRSPRASESFRSVLRGVPRVVALVALLAVSGACAPVGSTSRDAAPRTPDPSSAPVSFRPSSASVSGRVVTLLAEGVLIDSAGHQIEVRIDPQIDVWKETTVSARALEVGDNLFVNGNGGTPFLATYVWANIGRIDGTIRSLDATGMLLEVAPRAGGTTLERVDFSAYVQYGTVDGSIRMTRSDLSIGRVVSAVVYLPPAGVPRATRIW